MAALSLLVAFHLFLSCSPIFTAEQLRSQFLDPSVNPSTEIEPEKLCQEYEEFYKTVAATDYDVKLDMVENAYGTLLFLYKDSYDRAYYRSIFKRVQSAVLVIKKEASRATLKKELYYWIKMFVNNPADVVEFKFCLFKSEKYYIMTEITHGDLKEISEDFRKKFSFKQQLRVFVRMQEILVHVHNLGIVHRDVKPQNYVVHNKSPDDFRLRIQGFTKAEEADRDSLVGTPLFMPPEAFQGQKSTKNNSGDICAQGL